MITVTRDFKLLEKTENCELIHVTEWEIENLKTIEKRFNGVYYIVNPLDEDWTFSTTDPKAAYEEYYKLIVMYK